MCAIPALSPAKGLQTDEFETIFCILRFLSEPGPCLLHDCRQPFCLNYPAALCLDGDW